jgi:hypothetical protein
MKRGDESLYFGAAIVAGVLGFGLLFCSAVAAVFLFVLPRGTADALTIVSPGEFLIAGLVTLALAVMLERRSHSV